jgi:hypothetical protein
MHALPRQRCSRSRVKCSLSPRVSSKFISWISACIFKYSFIATVGLRTPTLEEAFAVGGRCGFWIEWFSGGRNFCHRCCQRPVALVLCAIAIPLVYNILLQLAKDLVLNLYGVAGMEASVFLLATFLEQALKRLAASPHLQFNANINRRLKKSIAKKNRSNFSPCSTVCAHS